jgi:hypothetical protein
MTTDEQLRGFVTAAYLHLAHFRDDVDSPIDPSISAGLTPARTMNVLDPYLALSRSILAETDELMIEFGEFERLSRMRAQQ